VCVCACVRACMRTCVCAGEVIGPETDKEIRNYIKCYRTSIQSLLKDGEIEVASMELGDTSEAVRSQMI